MSPHLKFGHWLVIIAPIILAVTALAWSGGKTNNQNTSQDRQDTVPAKKYHKEYFESEKDEKDLDKAIKDLDKAAERLAGKVENIDWEKMDMQIEKSMKNLDEQMAHHDLDMGKMEQDIEKAMKDIDFEKIGKETNEAVQQAAESIDFKKMEEDVQKSLKEVKEQLNSPEFRKNLEDAKNIDMAKIKDEIEHARAEMESSKVDMKEEMGKAKEEIKNAKEELIGYRQMLNEMEKEGLINTQKDYSIEYKSGDLFVNDQKEARSVTDKYRNYFKKDNTRIYKKNGRFNITID